MKVGEITLGVSPITNRIYAYKGDKENGNRETNLDESLDVTNNFIGCLHLLLKGSSNGVVHFSTNDTKFELRFVEVEA